jgi:hypothetical protein
MLPDEFSRASLKPANMLKGLTQRRRGRRALQKKAETAEVSAIFAALREPIRANLELLRSPDEFSLP